MLDTAGVVSMLMIAAGLILIAAGAVMRHAALYWIERATSHPIANASRGVIAFGALLTAAGAGGMLATGLR